MGALPLLLALWLPASAPPPPGDADAAADPVASVARLAAAVEPKVLTWRRHIHSHPELSNREQKTGAYVTKVLRSIGVDEITEGVARHGVVGLIRGARPGPTVALRADMDALPVTEATGLPFSSKVKGVMHACGHDGHTAVLLGAAAVLVKLKHILHGNVKLIFQPAEEGAPSGEVGGASEMVKAGVLKAPPVAAIFGLHVFPDLPTGSLGVRSGGMMASVDRFRVVVKGKQTHAARPWRGIDPVVAASHVVTAAQTIVSRQIDTRRPAVVTFGTIEGGQRWNIVPSEVVLTGTVRTHDPEVRRQVEAAFERVVTKTAEAQGATAEVRYEHITPVLVNDPALTARMRRTLARVTGAGGKVADLPPSLGGEDFAFYAREVPAMYFRLGVGNPAKGAVHGVHTPRFVMDEDALTVGVRAMSQLAVDYLSEPAR